MQSVSDIVTQFGHERVFFLLRDSCKPLKPRWSIFGKSSSVYHFLYSALPSGKNPSCYQRLQLSSSGEFFDLKPVDQIDIESSVANGNCKVLVDFRRAPSPQNFMDMGRGRIYFKIHGSRTRKVGPFNYVPSGSREAVGVFSCKKLTEKFIYLEGVNPGWQSKKLSYEEVAILIGEDRGKLLLSAN